MRKLLVLPLSLLAAGCWPPHPPPPPPPPELGRAPANCADAIFPLNSRIAAWSVDKFAGRYARGAETLVVSRNEHRLLVSRPGFGTRQINAPDVESRQWHDACGVRYDFTLPAGGPGARLRITDLGGAVSGWHRQGR